MLQGAAEGHRRAREHRRDGQNATREVSPDFASDCRRCPRGNPEAEFTRSTRGRSDLGLPARADLRACQRPVRAFLTPSAGQVKSDGTSRRKSDYEIL